VDDEARELFRLATADLREVGAALVLGLCSSSDVIALAADFVAEGQNSPSLLALASLYASATSADVVDLSSRVLTEAGVPPLDRDGEEIPLLALRVACRRFLDGELGLREFSSWAHNSIGHDGPEAAQALVEVDDVLDDLYATQGITGSSQHRAVERRYREEVAQLAATYLASTAPRPKHDR
jgi:hypothetical protein